MALDEGHQYINIYSEVQKAALSCSLLSTQQEKRLHSTKESLNTLLTASGWLESTETNPAETAVNALNFGTPDEYKRLMEKCYPSGILEKMNEKGKMDDGSKNQRSLLRKEE